jgi:hypothetical protein
MSTEKPKESVIIPILVDAANKASKENNKISTIPKRKQRGGYKKIEPRWKKGESGNPAGRKPDTPKAKALKRGFKEWSKEFTNSDEFIEDFKQALQNSDRLREIALHYGVGKPADVIQVQPPGMDLRNLPDEDLAKIEEIMERNKMRLLESADSE